MQKNGYTAESIEVLRGLDPVRQRPGMYTETTRPNHLAQEVIDNSVDEAIAGFASQLQVTLFEDNSLEVTDNGRGMPVDIHPEEGISGVELILTKLHAGAKFSGKDYRFSGGLHGVGVSVVNALSHRLTVDIRRDAKTFNIAFENGDKVSDLIETGTVGKKNTGTTLRFWPDPKYFDFKTFSISRLKHILRAKAVLCPGLKVTFNNKTDGTTDVWHYADGLQDYLLDSISEEAKLPEQPFTGSFSADTEAIDWAVIWLPEGGEPPAESYVNLIPTAQGGTHVNGFRTGLLAAMRDFCDFRKILPRGVKLAPEDISEGCGYILSFKMHEPQFSGQTKERLSSRSAAAFVSGVVRDAFSIWLNRHTDDAEALAGLIIEHAQKRLRTAKKVTRKKITAGPALPGKLADCVAQDLMRTELFLVEGDSAGGSAKQARDRQFQAVMPLRGKIKNTWEDDSSVILNSAEIHDISVAIGVDPNSSDLSSLRYGKICILADADSDGLHIATLICALFTRHYAPLVKNGHVYVAMPPLYRVDVGKSVYYALDEAEKTGILDRIKAEKKRGNVNVVRFKGLGEMNPLQLRETTMSPDTRRLVKLTVDDMEQTHQMLDMMLAKKRVKDRREWLETKGNLANPTPEID